jgi:hypothetical protein
MTTSAILVLVSICALLFLFRAVLRRNQAARRLDDPAGRVRPVDLEAFRNLVDRDEEAFLRRHLPPRRFRKVQRARLRAAAEYVCCVAGNAAILLRLGEAAGHSPDPRIAQAGRELVDNALRLRRYSVLALAQLYVGVLFPGSRITPAGIADQYQQLSAALTQMGRLQYPSRGARVSATL